MENPLGLPVHACSEVIAMDDDPANSVRKKKDLRSYVAPSLCANGKASAMVSAGNNR